MEREYKEMNKNTKKKQSGGQPFVATFVVLLIGGFCGYFIGRDMVGAAWAERPMGENILRAATLFLSIYIGVILQTIIHEAGHLVFGLLSGYRFSSFRVFSFMWVKEKGRVKLCRYSLAGTGGQCIMCPPDMKDGKIPVKLYNFGGSIMNAITGVFFLFLCILLQRSPFVSTVFLFFAVIGFASAVLNGVPMRMGAVDNDGYNAMALARDPEAMRSFWVQLKANEEIAKGMRLKDMPKEWFVLPSDEGMKNSMTAVMGVLYCNRLMDEKRFEEADRLMAHLLEVDSGIAGLYRGLLVCDRMYVELITENRKEVLEELQSQEQKRFMKQMKNSLEIFRTEYVYALLQERNPEKAAGILAQFEKAGKMYPYESSLCSERELIQIAEKLG